jgi:hypothetical protein
MTCQCWLAIDYWLRHWLRHWHYFDIIA